MAGVSKTHEGLLVPPARQLERALRISAERATRLAAAFGLKVPGIKRADPKATQAKARKPVR